MIFVPFKRVVIETPLSPSGIVDSLTPRVCTKFYSSLHGLMGEFDFAGRVTPKKINLLPVISWNNLYIPQFKGKIFATDSGSRLVIIIIPSIFNMLVFLLFTVIPPLYVKKFDFSCFCVGFSVVMHVFGCLIGFHPVVKEFEIKLRNILDVK